MEMPGPWKAWKSKSSFSPLSTAPWESRQRREIPTFPQPGMPRMGKWKTKIRFPTFPRGACDDDRGLSVFRTKNQERRSARFAASSITFFRIHARLETELCFRIILRLENAGGVWRSDSYFGGGCGGERVFAGRCDGMKTSALRSD